MREPILRREDHEAWELWQRTALIHSRTAGFRRRVDSAKRAVLEAVDETEGNLCLMWSAGKDSTAMVHLVCVEMGLELAVYSVRDDLDYPGEEQYVIELGSEWGLDLTIVRPEQSAAAWVARMAACGELGADDPIHNIDHPMARELFESPLMAASGHHAGYALGLRADESRARRENRKFRGRFYRLKSGRWVSQPLADWAGLDVFAYCASREVELLPLYKCLAFAHSQDPWRLREDWWLPGVHAATGSAAWLRHYYPSLYRQLCEWWPEARMLA